MDEIDKFSGSSKINSAVIVNFTLNNLWIDSFRHMRSGEYLKWNNDLDCIWTILGGEPAVIGDGTNDKFIEIETKLVKYGTLTNNLEIKGFNTIDNNILEILAKQKSILMEKSLFLRRLQNKQGKGTAYYDEDEDDFD